MYTKSVSFWGNGKLKDILFGCTTQYTELPLCQRFQHRGPTKAWYWSRFLANTCPSSLKQSVWLMKGMFARKRYWYQQQVHEFAVLETLDRRSGKKLRTLLCTTKQVEYVFWEMSAKRGKEEELEELGKIRKILNSSTEGERERGSWNAFEMTRNLTALEGKGRIWESSIRVWDWRFKHETLANLQDLFHGAASYRQPQRSTSDISAAFHNRMWTGDSNIVASSTVTRSVSS